MPRERKPSSKKAALDEDEEVAEFFAEQPEAKRAKKNSKKAKQGLGQQQTAAGMIQPKPDTYGEDV